MLTLVFGVTCISLYTSYLTGQQEARKNLQELATSHALLLETLFQQLGSKEAALQEFLKAKLKKPSFTDSVGEIVIAIPGGGSVSYLIWRGSAAKPRLHRQEELAHESPAIEKALQGESGTMITKDYRGREVIAAYAPIPSLGWGLVRKVDLRLIEQPFLRTSVLVLAGWLVLIGFGVFIFLRVNGRLIDELEETTIHLRRAKSQAEEADRSKNRFLAVLSHEERTPLGAIIGFTDLVLMEQNLSVAQCEYLHTVKRNANHLLLLIEDLLDYSKIEAGKVAIKTVKLDLLGTIQDCVMTVRSLHEKPEVPIRIQYARHVPEYINIDGKMLRQILLNLLSNATKFTKAGRIELFVEVKDIQSVKAAAASHKLVITVNDTGCGIPTAKQGRIFEPFFRASQDSGGNVDGSGLGLALSKRLAGLLGGDLWLVESELHKGSRFSCEIPITLPKQVNLIDGSNLKICPLKLPPWRAEKPLCGMRVLVAEDSPDLQLLAKHFLESAGASVCLVNNGASSVETAINGKFDIVLMDLEMPQLDGYQATRALRKKGFKKPIIAVSAHAMQTERQKCMRMGCNDYIAKPYNSLQLINCIKNISSSCA